MAKNRTMANHSAPSSFHSHLSRTAFAFRGYDVANLSMNLAKILIVVIFIHQDTLYGQLGLDMFKQLYYVFVAGEPDSHGNAELDAQVIEASNPKFSITILPLSIWIRYDRVKVEIHLATENVPVGLKAGTRVDLKLVPRPD